MAEQILVKLDLSGLSEWDEFTAEMEERATDLRPVWDYVHAILRGEVRRQFESEGAYFGGAKWTPLSPKYAEWKLNVYGPMPILQRELSLMPSLVDEAHPQHVYESAPDAMVYGTTVPYGQHHQLGGDRLPQRKILVISDAHRRLFVRAALTYILRGSPPDAPTSEWIHG